MYKMILIGGVSKVASAESVKVLNDSKQNKIIYGTDIPTSLEEGEIFLQVL